jgi:hypothetical protein
VLRVLLVTLLCGATACVADESPTVIYVSPSGNDAGPGTQTRPFRTLERARAEVAKHDADMAADIHVELLPGTYELADTFTLGPADSGTNGFRIIYEAAEGPESVRLLGGTRITEWSPYRGEIVSAKVSGEFHTLYENGIRADEARYPNRAPLGGMRHGPYLVSAGAADSHRVIDVVAPLPPIADPSELRVFIWSNAGHAWFTDLAPVKTLADHQIELGVDTRYPIGTGSRFYLQGAFELLDTPGEYYLDRTTSTLYYWPRGTGDIIAPHLTTLVALRGAHDVELRAIRFEATDFADTYRFGEVNGQFERQIELPEHRVGMITLEDTKRVRITDSHLVDAGYGGIYMLFHNEGAEISGNLIESVGISGVTLQGAFPGDGDVAHDNSIANNLIRNVGELAGHAAGIDISNAGHNVIANDRITDSPRFGLVIHAIAHTPGDQLYAEGNDVHGIEIANTCQDSGDAGALYLFGLFADGTAPRQNSFREIEVSNASPDPSMKDLAPNGVFTDNDSGMQSFEDIHVVSTPGRPYRTNDALAQKLDNVSWQSDFDESRRSTSASDERSARIEHAARYVAIGAEEPAIGQRAASGELCRRRGERAGERAVQHRVELLAALRPQATARRVNRDEARAVLVVLRPPAGINDGLGHHHSLDHHGALKPDDDIGESE